MWFVKAKKLRTSQETGWDKVAAAKYLDDRMDTSCVSCHTVIPYVMASPELRKATGVSQQTPQEARLLNETLRRVDTYGSHEPFYKGKEEQSRGTEAVLNLSFWLVKNPQKIDRH